MELTKQNVLFFTRNMKVGGTETVILQLCEILKPAVNKIVVCSGAGENTEKLKAMDIRHYEVPDLEEKQPNNVIKVIRTLKKVVKDEKITVIHTHHRMAAFYCQFLKSHNDLILINTSHTAFYDKRLLTHIAFRKFSMIACGEGVKESLVDGLGFPAARITVIRNGVKSDQNSKKTDIPEVKSAREKGDQIIAVIGRLSKEKGVDILIRALALLSTQHFLCVVVGTGAEENRLHNLVSDNNLEDKVVFLGYRADIANVISQVDFVVQPSLQEGLPLVPIEAFSVGRTVVATDVPGTKEIVKDGENGLLVEPGDAEKLAQKIIWMMDHSTEQGKMGQAAKAKFDNDFSFDVFARSYMDYYRSL